MQTDTADAISAITAREAWTADDYRELLSHMGSPGDGARLARALAQIESDNPAPKGAVALKIGIGRFVLCRFRGALAALAEGTDNKDRHYFQALSWKMLTHYAKALEELDRARAKGFDDREIDRQEIEVKALAYRLDEAASQLSKRERTGATADLHYLRGLIAELGGYGDQAVEHYEQARAMEAGHSAATFRLAYYWDLHGQEEQAIELYKECLKRPPVYVNALLNLAVLYEDQGRCDQSINCLSRVLAINPSHPRARLFLKDAEASRTMYYDEEQAKRIARRNAVLDVPVTDFELSVRARNCLKKMNIRTLGDLARISEAELLSYKNFGETSLKEIKDMLTSRGLRLGQGVEEPMGELTSLISDPVLAAAPVAPAGTADVPIEQVELSVRVRRALETLKVHTLGQLAQKSEADLLTCKNFGQTSLNEVRQRLAEYGLQLHE
jgi:DNA-directed RNA polymerase subunit alpha